MKLLNFKLPYYSRIQYVSKSALDYWNPIIQKLHKNLRIIERYSALNKNRKLAIQYVTEDEYNSSEYIFAEKHSCIGLNSRINYHEFNIPKKFIRRLAFCNNDNKAEVEDILVNNNLHEVGKALGYPECCVDFLRNRVKLTAIDSLIDPIHLIDNSNFNYKNNILLSSLGINLISHYPCSFNCEESIKIAEQRENMYRDMFFETADEDLKNLQILLSCKTEWSTLHGIAEIKTPIFKISKHSDAYSHNLVCKFNENCNDDIMYKAIGNKFPYL